MLGERTGAAAAAELAPETAKALQHGRDGAARHVLEEDVQRAGGRVKLRVDVAHDVPVLQPLVQVQLALERGQLALGAAGLGHHLLRLDCHELAGALVQPRVHAPVRALAQQLAARPLEVAGGQVHRAAEHALGALRQRLAAGKGCLHAVLLQRLLLRGQGGAAWAAAAAAANGRGLGGPGARRGAGAVVLQQRWRGGGGGRGGGG
jgi:hypothetical protein